MSFSSRLVNLIEEHDITQKQLSSELHIAPTTLSGYVNNHREPDFDILVLLSRYFHVSTDYLLGLTDEKLPSPSSLNASEGALIRRYRAISPEQQKALMDQAEFYYRSGKYAEQGQADLSD